MAITFRYVHIQRPDGTLRRAPNIPIYILDGSGRLIRVIALIDSGADVTVIPKDLATLLGLKEDKVETETAGIGGEVKVRKSRLKFRVIGERENYSLDVPVLILQDENVDVPLLLGRNGFFENFHITFQQNKEKIVLKKIEPKIKY